MTHVNPSVVELVYVPDADGRVFVLHLYVGSSKVEIPLALAEDLLEGPFDESLAVQIYCCVAVA